MYNTRKIKEVLYRADPKYFVSKEVNEGWHDWAYMDRGAMGEVPVHIICFVMLETLSSSFNFQGQEPVKSGLHVVCHSLTGTLDKSDKPHPESRIVMAGKKDCYMKKGLEFLYQSFSYCQSNELLDRA